MPGTPVQQAASTLFEAFKTHAKVQGDEYTLTKGELKNLLKEHFGSNMLGMANPIFQDMDENKDNVVDFPEFMKLIGAVNMLYQATLSAFPQAPK